MNFYKMELGKYEKLVQEKIADLKDQKIVQRIWEKDHTVWRDNPAEISNRLGWLDCAEVAKKNFNEINDFVDVIRSEGFKNVLLLGMGGSSLAPEVFAKIFGTKEGYLNLSVLDSTHPDAVSEMMTKYDPSETIYIVSTKSGGTVETISFMKYFYNFISSKVGNENVWKHFVAITDPNSGLEEMATELKFRKIFLNDPNIGGRYSALSLFGIVPAALIGVDLVKLFDAAQIVIDHSKLDDCYVAQLGTAIGVLAQKGVDKLTFILSDKLNPIGAWVEQLIAESSGKEGKGILPIEGEEILSNEKYSRDRIFVYLHLKDDNTYTDQVARLVEAGFPVLKLGVENIYELGAEFFRWEMATAIMSWVIDIQPFDQPNVESAKVIARKMVSDYLETGKIVGIPSLIKEDSVEVIGNIKTNQLSEVLPEFLNSINLGIDDIDGRSYISIQAYTKMNKESEAELQKLRTKIQEKYKVATTVGFGPRFLHSTGQLHKGDAGNGLFIQIITKSDHDIAIPDKAGEVGSSISFGVLVESQALGDRQALIDNNRKVIRFDISKDLAGDLSKISKNIA